MSETLLIKIVCTIHLASIWEAEHWTELLADNQSAIRTHLLSTRERAVAKTIKNIQVTRLQMLQVAVSWMPPPFAARTSYFKISEEAETSAGNLAEKDGNDVLHRRVSIYLSINLSIYLSIYLSIHPSIHPSIYIYISLSVYISVCLSVFLPTCLHASLSLFLSRVQIYQKFSTFLNITVNIVGNLLKCVIHMVWLTWFCWRLGFLSFPHRKWGALRLSVRGLAASHCFEKGKGHWRISVN